MVKIIQQEHETLRQVAKPVEEKLFGSLELQKILTDMSTALASCDDGVALAAPQINISLRIFIVAGKLFKSEEDKTEHQDLVFINPIITKRSKKVNTLDEGCLSVRWLYGKTQRNEKVTIEAQDENGDKFVWNGSGLLAQIFQHEVDHLDGVLFIDHAKDIQEIKPENS